MSVSMHKKSDGSSQPTDHQKIAFTLIVAGLLIFRWYQSQR